MNNELYKKNGIHQYTIHEKGNKKNTDHQYINQHLYQRTECYDAVEGYSTFEQKPVRVTGGRIQNWPLSHEYIYAIYNSNINIQYEHKY